MEETKKARVEDLDEQGIINLLERWEMNEFVDFVRVKHLDGVKLLAVSEGIVKLWRPKCKAKKFMEFIAQLKIEPEKYLKEIDVPNDTKTDDNIEAQYQTVNVKRIREQITSTSIGVEEILKKIVPSKSFLYRNHLQTVDTTDKHSNTDEINDRPVTSYTPMDSKNQKRPRRHLHIGFDENPRFSLKNWRLSRQEAYNDRGYYSVKTNPRYNIQNSTKTIDCKAKYKPLSTATELEKFPEEHFYEDLNYNDEGKRNNDNDVKDIKGNVKPKMVKIHELLSSLRLPFFKRSEESGVAKNIKIEEINEDDKKFHIYENNDSITSMYDSINADKRTEIEKQREVEVEEYLEPVQVNRDYCDVAIRQRDDSILSYILTLFESFGIRRETTDTTQDVAPEPVAVEGHTQNAAPIEAKEHKSKMADRPLPVPIENEPFFMDIGRFEAENLLMGQPDGAFVLRPSTQPNHAYTLTVSCSNAVHNVGIRRRPDGRLALGFARRGERSFETINSLLRHHKKHRLLLLANGEVCGATILNETPQYYQTPRNLHLLKVVF